MKITIYLNDYKQKYRGPVPSIKENLSYDLIKKIVSPEHTYILRGEPTLREDLGNILDLFKKKNYILTTDGSNVQPLIDYKKTIPYIAFNWDGYMNDIIRGHRPLSFNIQKALEYFKNKKTITRIEYKISSSNLATLKNDAYHLRQMLDLYPRMKRPYFLLMQQAEIFDEHNFLWIALGKEHISNLNKMSLLTADTFNYMLSWANKKSYSCVAPQNELTINYDGSVRICQSFKFKEVIGNINDSTLDEIIASTEAIRKACTSCSFKNECWLAYHYKENAK